MILRQAKKILVALLLSVFSSGLFAVEEYVSKLYKDIDVVFIQKSDDGLNSILQENKDDKNYYLIENYTEKKIRRLIVVNDYEFAMNAIVVVIENNLDNEEAVEMYSIIAEAYELQLQYEAELEEKRQQELARIEDEKEKQRSNVDKEYIAAKTTGGEAVYVTGKETKLSHYNCDFSFGLINFAITNETSLGFMGTNYGLSGILNYTYDFGKVLGGFDVYGAMNFLPISTDGNEITLITDMDFAPKFAIKGLSKNLFLRAGLSIMKTGKKDDVSITDNVAGAMISPIFGVELNKAKLGLGSFSFNADYLLNTIWDSNYKAGVQGLIDISLPYAQLDKINLNFHIGVKDRLLITNNGIENRAALIFAIGAENVNN